VLIVGAGPSGMECAVVLGKRQMAAVHVREQEDDIGGALRWITKLGHSDGGETGDRWSNRGLAEWGRITDHRRVQLSKLRNVEVFTDSRMNVDSILDYGAQLVVIATGSRFASNGMNAFTHEPIPGVDCSLDWQATPPEIVRGTKVAGERVLVYESEDYYFGASVAQFLADEGRQVTIVTQHSTLASWMEKTLEHAWMQGDLRRLGVTIMTGTMLHEVRPGVAVTADVWLPDVTQELRIDSVVACSARLSNSELFEELRGDAERLAEAGIDGLYVVGSAAAPGMIVDSIFEGHRLAREIDSVDPSQPLPFIRERRIWGATDNDRYERILRRVAVS
jgi:dimethylamine/trimethylamine dehydrogenase